MSWTSAATRFTGTTAIWRRGSNATPPQCAPPMFDGIASVPSRLGGVNGAFVAQRPDLRETAVASSGVTPRRRRVETAAG